MTESVWTANNMYRLSIIGFRNYNILKQSLLVHSFRQLHVTKVTCSLFDAIPLVQVRISCAIAHMGEKYNLIDGILR